MNGPSGKWGDRGFGQDPNQDSGHVGGPNPSRGRSSCTGAPRATASLAFGTLALVAGVTLLLDRFGIIDAGFVFRFWPVVLIGLGIGFLLRGRGAILPGTILTFLGTLFLVRNLGYADVHFRDLWPVLLIIAGATVLLNTFRARRSLAQPTASPAGPGDLDVLNDFAMFGGVVKNVQSQSFRGGELFAMFGGIEVNLRKARLVPNEPVILNATAIMGGVELRVPDDWYIVNEGLGLFGGYSDSRKFIETEGGAPIDHTRTLIVRGVAVFGGVDIKN